MMKLKMSHKLHSFRLLHRDVLTRYQLAQVVQKTRSCQTHRIKAEMRPDHQLLTQPKIQKSDFLQEARHTRHKT